MTETLTPAFGLGDAVKVGDVDHLEELARFTNRTGIILRIINEPDELHDWEFLPCYIVDFGPAVDDVAELFEQELELVERNRALNAEPKAGRSWMTP